MVMVVLDLVSSASKTCTAIAIDYRLVLSSPWPKKVREYDIANNPLEFPKLISELFSSAET